MRTFFYEIIDEPRDFDTDEPLTIVSVADDDDGDLWEITLKGRFDEFSAGSKLSLVDAIREKMIEHGDIEEGDPVRFEEMLPLQQSGYFDDGEDEEEDAEFEEESEDDDESESEESQPCLPQLRLSG